LTVSKNSIAAKPQVFVFQEDTATTAGYFFQFFC